MLDYAPPVILPSFRLLKRSWVAALLSPAVIRVLRRSRGNRLRRVVAGDAPHLLVYICHRWNYVVVWTMSFLCGHHW